MYTTHKERAIALAPDPGPYDRVHQANWQNWLDAGVAACVRLNAVFAKVRMGRV